MPSLAFAAAYASVDPLEGQDVRIAASRVLRELKVLALLRDASTPFEEGEEAVYVIPLTDEGRVLTLDGRDAVVATLSAARLREAFAASGLRLWLDTGDDPVSEEEHEDSLAVSGAAGESVASARALAGTDDEEHEDDTEEEAEERRVLVAEYSHRARGLARGTAEIFRVPVVYAEEGEWSLVRYETEESRAMLPPSRREAPVIALNVPPHGEPWIEVTLHDGLVVPVWPDAERDTRAVLDLDEIRRAESIEIYRRFLAEGDGMRDELEMLAEHVPLDIDAAHRAIMPEEAGGLRGGRTEAFIAAFGVPQGLIERGEERTPLEGETLIEPRGWARAALEVLVGGSSELRPLTRRAGASARVEDGLRRRPGLAVTLSAAEVAAGAFATAKLRGGWKALGILVVLDGVADLALHALRRRR